MGSSITDLHKALLSSKALTMFPERLTDAYEWQGHIPFAFWLTEILQPAQYVELGAYKGDSFVAFCQAVSELGLNCKAHAIDTWAGDDHVGAYGDEVYDDLRQYHDAKYAAFSRLHRMRFEEAVDSFADHSIDLLHIDGLHTYEAVKNDFETWKDKLSDRAVVLFHDCAVRERGFGVWQYMDELAKTYPVFTFNHSNGLACLVYGKKAPEALQHLAATEEKDASYIRALFHALGDRVAATSQMYFWRRESEKQFNMNVLLKERESSIRKFARMVKKRLFQ